MTFEGFWYWYWGSFLIFSVVLCSIWAVIHAYRKGPIDGFGVLFGTVAVLCLMQAVEWWGWELW